MRSSRTQTGRGLGRRGGDLGAEAAAGAEAGRPGWEGPRLELQWDTRGSRAECACYHCPPSGVVGGLAMAERPLLGHRGDEWTRAERGGGQTPTSSLFFPSVLQQCIGGFGVPESHRSRHRTSGRVRPGLSSSGGGAAVPTSLHSAPVSSRTLTLLPPSYRDPVMTPVHRKTQGSPHPQTLHPAAPHPGSGN